MKFGHNNFVSLDIECDAWINFQHFLRILCASRNVVDVLHDVTRKTLEINRCSILKVLRHQFNSLSCEHGTVLCVRHICIWFERCYSFYSLYFIYVCVIFHSFLYHSHPVSVPVPILYTIDSLVFLSHSLFVR